MGCVFAPFSFPFLFSSFFFSEFCFHSLFSSLLFCLYLLSFSSILQPFLFLFSFPPFFLNVSIPYFRFSFCLYLLLLFPRFFIFLTSSRFFLSIAHYRVPFFEFLSFLYILHSFSSSHISVFPFSFVIYFLFSVIRYIPTVPLFLVFCLSLHSLPFFKLSFSLASNSSVLSPFLPSPSFPLF